MECPRCAQLSAGKREGLGVCSSPSPQEAGPDTIVILRLLRLPHKSTPVPLPGVITELQYEKISLALDKHTLLP